MLYEEQEEVRYWFHLFTWSDGFDVDEGAGEQALEEHLSGAEHVRAEPAAHYTGIKYRI